MFCVLAARAQGERHAMRGFYEEKLGEMPRFLHTLDALVRFAMARSGRAGIHNPCTR
jgi:hypothetical protein